MRAKKWWRLKQHQFWEFTEMPAKDKVFTGSIPDIYDDFPGPLIFEAYSKIWRGEFRMLHPTAF